MLKDIINLLAALNQINRSSFLRKQKVDCGIFNNAQCVLKLASLKNLEIVSLYGIAGFVGHYT